MKAGIIKNLGFGSSLKAWAFKKSAVTMPPYQLPLCVAGLEKMVSSSWVL